VSSNLTTQTYTPKPGNPQANPESVGVTLQQTGEPEAPRTPLPVHNVVAISDAAIRRLREVSGEQGVELVGVRVGVTGGGCSGLSYVLDFEKSPRLGDQVFGEDPKIFVDRKSFVFLRGTTLDFEGGLNGKGFVFVNPNAKASCGCGSSFSA
jgi:iron-sulfur cluster assembly protein